MTDPGRQTVIPSDLGAARVVQEEIEASLAAYFTEHDLFAIKMAVEEALVNAIKHGNQMDPGKFVRVAYALSPARFEVRITDEGPGFNPDDVPDPTSPENLERPCGRGKSFLTALLFLCLARRNSPDYVPQQIWNKSSSSVPAAPA